MNKPRDPCISSSGSEVIIKGAETNRTGRCKGEKRGFLPTNTRHPSIPDVWGFQPSWQMKFELVEVLTLYPCSGARNIWNFCSLSKKTPFCFLVFRVHVVRMQHDRKRTKLNSLLWLIFLGFSPQSAPYRFSLTTTCCLQRFLLECVKKQKTNGCRAAVYFYFNSLELELRETWYCFWWLFFPLRNLQSN